MHFMLIHAIDEDVEFDNGPDGDVQAALKVWLDDVVPTGIDVQGSRLHPSSDATTVRVRGGEVMLIDGPFAETKEQVGGYDILSCASIDEALAWAAKHPSARLGSIEVRPLLGEPSNPLLPAPAPMTTRYVMLVCVDESVHLTPEEIAGIGPATEAWVTETDDSGVRLFGNQLAPMSTARTLRVKGDDVIITDGPFAETKEQIAGFDVLECADLDEALSVAARHPVALFGSLEIRPFW